MPLQMYQELGLSPNEAKIYHCLITYGGSGVSTISLRSKIHRRNVYDAVQRLLEKGLVMEIYNRSETQYEAVAPGKLSELLQEKQHKLDTMMPMLRDLYVAKKAPEQAFIYKGYEGVKNYLRDVLEENEDMHIFGAEGAWFDPKLKSYTNHFLEKARKQGIKFYCLFEPDIAEAPEAMRAIADEYKIFSEEYNTMSTMDIFGDYVVTYTGAQPNKFSEDSTIFVMRSAELAESYRTWWQMVWNLLPQKSKKIRHTSKDKKVNKKK